MLMNLTPSIAVITPVRNGMAFLSGMIRCVLSQGYSPLELAIVDDGSTDGSAEAARIAGVQVFESRGVGPAAARNAGIRGTSSEAIAFLDVDDLWPPHTLHRLAAALAALPEAEFAQGRIQDFAIDDKGNYVTSEPYRFINLGASLYRRSLFDKVGLFDERLRLSEDVDFMMRCWEMDIPKAIVDEVTLQYRLHPNSLTAGLRGSERGTLKPVQYRLDRIRRGIFDPKSPRRMPELDYFGSGAPAKRSDMRISRSVE